MDELGRSARGAFAKVSLFKQDDSITARGCVDSSAQPRRATADYNDIPGRFALPNRIEPDIAARIDLYQKAEQLVVNDAAWVPLWYDGEQYALIKPYVEGYVITPMTVPRLAQVVIR